MLRALGVEAELAHTSIRFGVGRFNTEEEIDFVIRDVDATRAEVALGDRGAHGCHQLLIERQVVLGQQHRAEHLAQFQVVARFEFKSTWRAHFFQNDEVFFTTAWCRIVHDIGNGQHFGVKI